MNLYSQLTLSQEIASHLSETAFQMLERAAEKIKQEFWSNTDRISQNSNYRITSADYQKHMVKIIDDALLNVSPQSIGALIAGVQNVLSESPEALESLLKPTVDDLVASTQKFVNRIEEHKFGNRRSISQFMKAIEDFQTSLLRFEQSRSNLTSIASSMSAIPDLQEDESELRISFFRNEQSLSGFMELQSLLQTLYRIVARILDIDIQARPLRLNYYHSGSDNFSLIGPSPIMEPLTRLFEKLGLHIYREHTIAGRFWKYSEMYAELSRLIAETTGNSPEDLEVVADLRLARAKVAKLIHSNVQRQSGFEVNGNTFGHPKSPQLRITYEPEPRQRQLPPPSSDLDFQA